MSEKTENKRIRLSGWTIATIAVIVVGIVSALAVHTVQAKRGTLPFQRTVVTSNNYVTVATTISAEEEFVIENAGEQVDTDEDAVGGMLGQGAAPASDSGETTKGDSDDEGSDWKTFKFTTKKVTTVNSQEAIDDFWDGVSKIFR